MITGLTGAFATLAALREVEVRGGRGQVLDLSLLGTDAGHHGA